MSKSVNNDNGTWGEVSGREEGVGFRKKEPRGIGVSEKESSLCSSRYFSHFLPTRNFLALPVCLMFS